MKKVTVYSTTTCPYCVMVKRWLAERGIEFEDVLVDKDPAMAKKMVELSGQMGVPFTTIEDDESEQIQGILGFNIPSLTQALGLLY
ncbi:glutaredoxin family protein [Candidatus Saccharibacteria bacterium]|nr:glutaredoxin family protein [Candidatus Saccharibacteria bacterium]MCB9821076.1 glutaredoxin family protein [Candidatus Nomurabacteria bacterium]